MTSVTIAFMLIPFIGCSKMDDVAQSFIPPRPTPTPPAVVMSPSSVKVDLLIWDGESTSFKIDEVRYDFNSAYSKTYKETEDTLNVPRTVNDLCIGEINDTLRVNGLPYALDSIPLFIHNPVSRSFNFKFTLNSVPPEFQMFIVDKYKQTKPTDLPIYFRKEITSIDKSYSFYPNNEYHPDRFSLVFKLKTQ